MFISDGEVGGRGVGSRRLDGDVVGSKGPQ